MTELNRKKLRVGVVGVGALGKEHARIYTQLAQGAVIEFAGIYDTATENACAIADRFKVRAFASLEELAANTDALSIVTPTSTHFDLAKKLLGLRKHLLLEKPMTSDGIQAAELVDLAKKHACVLQVGHVERFNPIFKYLQTVAGRPHFIEAHRLSNYSGRSTDIGVVLDLMIHDLDLVLAFVRSPVQSIDAVGIPVLSTTEDIANARLRFENGCVANITVSRVSPERMRKIRVFSGGSTPSYVSLDYRAQEGFIYRIARDGEAESSFLKKLLYARTSTIVTEFAGKRIVREPVPITKEEPLKLELQHFVECIQAQQTPLVCGESARRALDLALEITERIRQSLANYPSTD